LEKKYTDLSAEEVDYVLVKTTSDGPYMEDVVFLIFAKATDSYWEVPQSSDKDFLNWLKNFPDVNMNQFIKSIGCTEDRIFILYRGPDYPVLSEKKGEHLKCRLENLFKENFDGNTQDFSNIADRIFRRYSESSRHYHNLEHIQNCLWELDQLSGEKIDTISIELAIWYHDLIYSPLSRSNELDSAQQLIGDLGAFPTQVSLENVYQMILCSPATSKFRNLSESEKFFLDIDYSILGQREVEYMVYKQNVRIEYRLIPSLIFHLRRKAFLTSLLKKDIYHTKWFKERYEENAMKNIENELSKMPYKILPTLTW
jgi:predicted metal-dependent HD superfamily phosphohydrolase